MHEIDQLFLKNEKELAVARGKLEKNAFLRRQKKPNEVFTSWACASGTTRLKVECK